MQSSSVRQTIVGIGREIGPSAIEAVLSLFDQEQHELAEAVPVTAADLAYGPHERHRLDIYAPATRDAAVPVLIWVHGGGFMRGDKGGNGRWTDANAGRMAAAAGFLGVVITYRLAPDFGWPAGAEDVAAVVDWVRKHASTWGGDPKRIVVAGTSAGAVHVAGYLKLRPHHADEVRAAIMLSGLYGFTPLSDVRDQSYYGEDASLHPARIPAEAVLSTDLPLFLAAAEFDPPRFQAEFASLLHHRLDRHGILPRSYIASGHNHYSLPYHLGTSDTRLQDEIIAFVTDVCGK